MTLFSLFKPYFLWLSALLITLLNWPLVLISYFYIKSRPSDSAFRNPHHKTSLCLSQLYSQLLKLHSSSARLFSVHGPDFSVSYSLLPCCLAAAAKLLQSCPTLCNPIDGSPPGFPVPEILQERTLEWVAISFSNAWKWKVKVKSLSCVRLFATPWTAAYQDPLPMGFSRQEYWSGLPLPHCFRLSNPPYISRQLKFQLFEKDFYGYSSPHWVTILSSDSVSETC